MAMSALDEGTTPFMRAARSGDAATMRVLLEAGADPKLVTKDGNNALLFAAGIGYRDKQTQGTDAQALEALKICIDQGLDLNQTNAKGENCAAWSRQPGLRPVGQIPGGTWREAGCQVQGRVYASRYRHGKGQLWPAGSARQHGGAAAKLGRR